MPGIALLFQIQKATEICWMLTAHLRKRTAVHTENMTDSQNVLAFLCADDRIFHIFLIYFSEINLKEESEIMDNWFTIDKIDENTHIISEYRHWEETHCYLLNGSKRSLLIDTGLGICNISEVIARLTDKPVTAVATHIHWDHIGGHKYYPDFYAHQAELNWLNGGFPQPLETIKGYVVERCELPEDFNINNYNFFQGEPTKTLHGGEHIELGCRTIEVIHTSGHSPGHMCFWEEKNRIFIYWRFSI